MSHLAGLLLLFANSAGVTPISEVLTGELKPAAEKVKVALKEYGVATVAIGNVAVSPPSLSATTTPLLKQSLSDALRTAGLEIAKKSKYFLNGSAFIDTNARLRRSAVVFAFELRDEANKVVKTIDESASHNNDVLASLAGANIAYGALEPDDKRNQVITQAILVQKNGEASPTGGPTLSPRTVRIGKYEIGLLVANGKDTEGKALTVECRPRVGEQDEAGLPIVYLEKGDEYQIKLVNNDDYEAAAEVLVDGLSMFAFADLEKTGGAKFSNIIVPKRGSATVVGWFKDFKSSAAFKVVEFPESAANQLQIEPGADLGTITVHIRQCWEVGMKSPNPAMSTATTGFGQDVVTNYVQVKKNFSKVVATISLRYKLK